MNKRRNRLTAVMAERLFGVVILLLLITLVVDFIFVTNYLKSQASATEDLHLQSDASDSDITKLKSADAWLNQHEDAVGRASAVVAQSKLYQYQNQIIEDFNGYADRAGLSVSGYTFTPSSTSSTTVPASPAAPSTPSPSSASSRTPPPTSTSSTATATVSVPVAQPTGVNSTTVTVDFGEKVAYQNFLVLLQLLEQNVTRMQVTNISLSPDPVNSQIITNPNLTATVYTR